MTTSVDFRWRYQHVFDPIASVSGFVQTCLNFYFIYVYLRKYPRESDIEFYAETALPPPVLAEGLSSANSPAPVKDASPVHDIVLVDDPVPVDDASSKAPDLQSPAISAAPGVTAENNMTETIVMDMT